MDLYINCSRNTARKPSANTQLSVYTVYLCANIVVCDTPADVVWLLTILTHPDRDFFGASWSEHCCTSCIAAVITTGPENMYAVRD